MRHASLIAGALVAMTNAAAAQPEPACEVRFVRAPDDVRHVIEAWLASEPRCTSTIDLRVIPTESGYYLLAQRPDGRIHERFVPDAQAAGVLVASWVADDWVAPHHDVWSTRRGTAAPAAPAPLAPPQYTTPGATPAVTAISVPPPRRGGPRWLSLSAMWADDQGRDGGLRAELDLISRGDWTFGAGVAWAETASDGGAMRNEDYWVTGTAAYSMTYGRWDMRLGSAFGLVRSDMNDMNAGISPHSTVTGVIIEMQATMSCRLFDNWGLTAGLVLSSIYETVQPDSEPSRGMADDQHFFLVTGLRRRI